MLHDEDGHFAGGMCDGGQGPVHLASQNNKSNMESAKQNVERVPAAERGGTVEGGGVAHINMVERAHEHGMTGSIAQTEAALTLANLQPHPHPHSHRNPNPKTL